LLSTSGNLDEAAKNLYSAMIRLDAQQLDVILAQFVPDKGVGKAINDRLKRASQK
jgi:L-threonylcarbamoyladenylate synthase